MDLSLDVLRESGAFVTEKPVEKFISWEQGGKTNRCRVYVRKLSYRTVVAEIESHREKVDFQVGRVAACICDEGGKAVFNIEDITGLKSDGTPVTYPDPKTGEEKPQGEMCESLFFALLLAVNEVNSPKSKTSPSKKKSGTS